MKLKPQAVRELIGYAERRELDNVVGVLVRLSRDELAELRALIWLGRGRENPRHWEALVVEARAKVDKETPRVLAEDPELADSLARGLERMEEAGRI